MYTTLCTLICKLIGFLIFWHGRNREVAPIGRDIWQKVGTIEELNGSV